MAITPLPPAPLPTDTPTEFNEKAFDLVAALDTFVTQTNATAVAVDADATAADVDAATATTKASEASASATLASNWATKTNDYVSGTDNSSKSWAIGGTSNGNPSGGAAKDWATKTDGAVAGGEFSAKKHATDAASSASAALTSANNAAASYDSFDDRYLGAKGSDPSVDNDGNALLTGALYWNTSANEMRVYSGSAWVATYVPAGSYLTSSDIGVSVQAYDSDLTTWAGKTAPTGTVVGTTDSQVLTNKTINGSNNTISNINLASQVTGTLPVANGGTGVTSSTGTGSIVLSTSPSLTTPTAIGFRETKVNIDASNIDLTLGNYYSKTISGTTTFTVSNVPATSTSASFILDLTNGGSSTVNWWSGMKWAGGTAPTLTASGRDVLGFFTYDGGTTWTGLVLGKDVK